MGFTTRNTCIVCGLFMVSFTRVTLVSGRENVSKPVKMRYDLILQILVIEIELLMLTVNIDSINHLPHLCSTHVMQNVTIDSINHLPSSCPTHVMLTVNIDSINHLPHTF